MNANYGDNEMAMGCGAVIVVVLGLLAVSGVAYLAYLVISWAGKIV